jgi:hypothetical protein
MNNLKLIIMFIFLISSSVFADNYKIIFPAPSQIAFEVATFDVPDSEDRAEIEFIHSVIGETSWELCFDTSVDGWTPEAFHSGCNGKGSTVTIANVPGQTVRFAAYSNIDWGSPEGYYFSTESRLMNLTDQTSYRAEGIYETGEKGVSVDQAKGPAFGAGHDLVFLYGGHSSMPNGYCFGHTYAGWDKADCNPPSWKFPSNVNVKVYSVF